MHLVCLGCMKKLLYMWVFIRSNRRLRQWEIQKISKRLHFTRNYIPVEFQRKPRPLQDLKYWKATEFRQLLLYTGPMILNNILPPIIFSHFNTLHVAIRILSSDILVQREDLLNYAEELLSHFVRSLSILYGEQNVSYNMHGLLHLVEDVRRFGKLDNFSAFKFENFMQNLKKWMRKGEKPLQQLVRRYTEFKINSGRHTKTQDTGIICSNRSEHNNGPLLENCSSPQYRAATVAGFKLDVKKEADKCFGLICGEIVLIDNVAYCSVTDEPVIIGKKFKTKRNFYETPCESSVVDEHVVTNLSGLKMWPLKNIVKKYMILPLGNDEYMISSLLHNERNECL